MTVRLPSMNSIRTPLRSRARHVWVAVGCLAVSAGMAGCSTMNVPVADNYPASSQLKARALHHWDVLADDVANRVAAKAMPAGAEPVTFHLHAADESPFNRAFADLLLTRLVDRGLVMAIDPLDASEGGANIRFTVQVVRHHSNGLNVGDFPLTKLMAGVAVVRDWTLRTHTSLAMGVAGVASGAVLDLTDRSLSGTAAGGPTRTEVLVTTSVERGKRYVARTSDIYYIEHEDSGLYSPPPKPAPPPPPAPMKNWKVVGS